MSTIFLISDRVPLHGYQKVNEDAEMGAKLMDDNRVNKFETGPALTMMNEPSAATLETAFCCVAQFSSAISNQSNVIEALAYFRAAFDLAKVVIYRIKSGDGEPHRIASVGMKAVSSEAIRAGFNNIPLGNIKSGSFQTSLTAAGATIVQIILQAGQQNTDVIVFEFQKVTDVATKPAIVAMAPAMAVAWRMRQPGLVGALIHAQTRTRQSLHSGAQDMPILSKDNAYGLSRSEHRVCHLLASGLKPQLIARELGVSITTIRTHLSNIYAKTDLPGQLEVVSHINRSAYPAMQAA